MKNPIVKTGILFGVAVFVWSLIFGAIDGHQKPALGTVSFVVLIALTVVFVVWGLMQTKALGKGYGGQLVSGLLICLVASGIIFVGSLILTNVVFPDYLAESMDVQLDLMAQRGLSEEQIEQQRGVLEVFMTPFVAAIMGVVGTMVTGLIVSLIVAGFIKHKA